MDEPNGGIILPTICALSLAGLRRRVEERLIAEDVDVRLVLDKAARLERDRRRLRERPAAAGR
jgi:hypothetical protein